jgi:hypothetical protein
VLNPAYAQIFERGNVHNLSVGVHRKVVCALVLPEIMHILYPVFHKAAASRHDRSKVAIAIKELILG